MITILHCGHDSHHSRPVEMEHRHGLDHYLLLLIKTEGYVEQKGQVLTAFPESAVLFQKNTPIRYGCRLDHYNDDWIHFSLSADEKILIETCIPFGAPFLPRDFQSLVQCVRLLVKETRRTSPASLTVQDALMRAILWKLSEGPRAEPETKHSLYPAFFRLRQEILNAPARDWDMDPMARSLNLSTSRFQHLYKEFFGLPPRRDLIRARLENSCFYLMETDMDIASVAAFCGYENTLHYMRQFKKYMGLTPSQYRAQTAEEKLHRKSLPHCGSKS